MYLFKIEILVGMVLICILEDIEVCATTCSQAFHIKKEHLNKRLVPYTLLEVTVAGHHDCARECFNSGGECKAINFNTKTKNCELKYKGSDSADVSEFEKTGGYIFSDITEWPKSMMGGGCAVHNCQDHQICLPLGNSNFQCVDKDCGRLSDITYGTVSAPITTHGATATYSCQYGYRFTSGDSTRKCVDGTWGGVQPSCTIQDCGQLADITYGTVSAPITTHGASATYSCQYGYELTTGDPVRKCVDGTWGGVQPSCTIQDCGQLADITYGTVSAPVTTHGASATYSCQYGYELNTGDPVRTCVDGTWGGVQPTCTIQGICRYPTNVGCYTLGYAYLYEGRSQYTRNGTLCQRWDAQSPHGHSYTNSDWFPENDITKAKNYCRDFYGDGGAPWCYTTDPGERWDFCSVQQC